jgi:hypothetical protein
VGGGSEETGTTGRTWVTWEQGSGEVDIRNPWIWGGSITGIEFASGGGWGREVKNVERG